MTKVTVVPAPSAQDNPVNGRLAGVGAIPLDTSQVSFDVGGSIDSIRGEIDDCFADMKTFHNREPDEIMRLCRGHSARLSEIRVRIMRVEDYQRQWRNIRTREIEPVLSELSDQWANASRLHSVRELDWRMEMGQA